MNPLDMFKQVQALQEKMGAMQAELAAMEIEGRSGGGLVKVVVNGKHETKRVTIDPSLLKPEDAGVVQDLIVAAANDARAKLELRVGERAQAMLGGMGLPAGFKLPF